MGDPLSVLAGTIAIFDFSVKGYRFARDVKNAGRERQEFEGRLNNLKGIEMGIRQCLDAGSDVNPGWEAKLTSKESPLFRLHDTVEDMLNTLGKAGRKKHQFRDMLWHSEKKSFGEFFQKIDSYCSQITLIVGVAGLRETKQVHVETKKVHGEVVGIRKDIERDKIDAWIPAIDFHARHRDFLDKAEKSGKDFLEAPVFKCWKEGHLRKLRCFGDRGAGKTVLCSMIVDHMNHGSSSGSPTLYLYIEEAPDVAHDIKNLVGSLLKQLIRFRNDALSKSVQDAWTKFKNDTPSEEVILSLFAEEVKSYDLVHVVIDAIDLLDNRTRDFIDNILLKTVCPEKVRLLTTSRRDVQQAAYYKICDLCKKDAELYLQCPDCGNAAPFNLCQDCHQAGKLCTRDLRHKPMEYPPVLETRIQASKEDLETYVKSLIKGQMPTKDDSVDPYMNPANNDGSTLGLECSEDPSLLNKVAECIVENSEGKFLMAKLYTKSLEDKLTNSEIESALDDLSCHRLSLADLINTSYTNDIRKRIQGQGTARAKQAFEILSIVYFARRKLRFREFLHALATKAKDRKFYNQKNEMREKDILKLTNGFITIGRDRDKIIRLTDDRTLREYFDDTCEDWFPEGERDMAERCVRYLSFETFAKPCEVDELQAKEKEHPFLSYAVQHWGTHVRLAAVQVEDFVIDFLQNTSRNQAYIQCAWELDTDEIEKWDVRRTIFPLHICAWFNLCYSIQELGDDIDYDIREGTYGQTALMYACRRGHKEMVKLLLDRGALLNITSDRGRTALFEAILRNNHVQINTTTVVDLLLNHPRHLEIDLNITNHQCFDRTVLMVAIDQNTRTSAAIAISLLKLPNLDRNKQDSRGNTALTLAAARGNLDVVNALMIFEDLKLDLRDSVAGRTALMYAAAGGHPNIVDALLQRGADLDLQDFSGATAALRAAEKANQEVLERLIKFGVNLTLVDKEGRTLMHGASQNGSVGVMELLVNFKEYTPKLDQRDKYGMTPLHVACGFGQLEAAKFLIAKGLDWKEVDSFNRTPFDIACHYGHETLIDLLEKQATAPGTTRMQRPKLEDLPLWSLAVQQNLDAVKTALSTGATDLSIREPGAERTVIHCAVRYCNGTAGPQILEAILNADDEYINEPDGFKDTPLHLAVRQNCLACTELLLEHDPTVDEPDRFGLTPLDQACRDENYDIAMLLLNAGAPIGNSNVGLSKMIFQAAELKNDNAVKRLLVAGADRMVPDEYGRTIDMLIKRTGNMKLLKIVQSFPSFRYPATKEKQGIVTVKEIEPPQIGSQGRLRRVSPV